MAGTVANKRVPLTPAKRFPLRRGIKKTKAESLIYWIEGLPVLRGKVGVGEKVKLYPFQKEILRGIFDDKNLVTHSVVSIPRKQGKSLIATWIALASLLYKPFQVRSAQIIVISPTAKQSGNLFDAMVDIIDHLPLPESDVLNIRINDKSITNKKLGIRFKVVASDRTGARLQGYEPQLAVLDEAGSMHQLAYQSLKTASPNLLLCISTQCHQPDGHNHWFTQLLQEENLPKHHYRYFKGATHAEARKDWDKETLWRKVTPEVKLKTIEYIRGEYEDAKMFGTENIFKAFHLNCLVQTLSDEVTLVTNDELEQAWKPDSFIPDNSKVVIGLDLAEVGDLTAIVVVTPTGETEAHFFIPEKTANEQKNIPYSQWAERGFVTLAPAVVDFRDVANKVLELIDKYEVLAICHDSWLSKQWQLISEEAGIKIPQHKVIQMGKSIGVATKELQRYIKAGKLKINSPVLRWNFHCTTWSADTHGNIRAHRGLSQRKKGYRIDGVVALLNSLYYMSENKLGNNNQVIFRWLE